jgi:hypothetical protein
LEPIEEELRVMGRCQEELAALPLQGRARVLAWLLSRFQDEAKPRLPTPEGADEAAAGPS